MLNVAILLAAGRSKRFKGRGIKQFSRLEKRYLIDYPLRALIDSPWIQYIILAVPKGWVGFVKDKIIKRYNLKGKKIEVVAGGRRRQDSAYKALQKIPPKSDFILFHDGARPFLTKGMISKSIKGAKKSGSCIFALPVTDTIKESMDGKTVKRTLSRSILWEIQTPQSFSGELIKRGFASAYRKGWYGTDTSSLVERIGGRVKIILGDRRNIKITTPEDLVFAKAIIRNGYRNRI